MNIFMQKKIRLFLAFSVIGLPCHATTLPSPPDTPSETEMGTTEQIELGRLLFFDKELSGNRNISCATCHHPLTHTGDSLSLSVGEGGQGLGAFRTTGSGYDAIAERVHRNSPALFNLGQPNATHLFHDGRVAIDPEQESGFISPAGSDLPLGLNNIVAVQAMFPVTSATEMAGQGDENEISAAVANGDLAGPSGVWELLAQRLSHIPGYFDLFKAAYPDQIDSSTDITFIMAANAIAAFEISTWSARNAPFDQQLRGENVMSDSALRGMVLFNEKGCTGCHGGPLQSDNRFHAIAMPQIGPGEGDNTDGFSDGLEDFGRERATMDIADRYKFRTPSLRNVELTAPYGHAGAYATLENIVRHYINPIGSLMNYDQNQVVLPSRVDLDSIDFVVMDTPLRVGAIAQAALREPQLRPVNMTPDDVADIVEFLKALTDPESIDLTDNIPYSVPSGLPIID
ncbi:hypothetical protein MO867_21260 [Microbulbifer sp. OS29]|uniref:Cytochrome c domain-containing protein n=1 Tax=Microbulbifer okhotskensis TaxID=2926617 RepID=A0A9X2ESW1_9GAMM|nr:cytochrome c peroxidase [Microbulbifer okhotskensis]MCO1336860.1 hypothetical protein [Microbulbifer okhotskensis]